MGKGSSLAINTMWHFYISVAVWHCGGHISVVRCKSTSRTSVPHDIDIIDAVKT